MKTLLSVLRTADAMQIDGHFIRWIALNNIDELESDQDIVLYVECEDNLTLHEWFFTVEQLESAVFNHATRSWSVNEVGEKQPYNITAYQLCELGE